MTLFYFLFCTQHLKFDIICSFEMTHVIVVIIKSHSQGGKLFFLQKLLIV